MSRFGTYLQSQKLAKSYLVTAEERLKHIKDEQVQHTMRPILAAVREVMTAINNVASMQFEKKRARVTRVKCPRCSAAMRGKGDLARHTQIVHPLAVRP